MVLSRGELNFCVHGAPGQRERLRERGRRGRERERLKSMQLLSEQFHRNNFPSKFFMTKCRRELYGTHAEMRKGEGGDLKPVFLLTPRRLILSRKIVTDKKYNKIEG